MVRATRLPATVAETLPSAAGGRSRTPTRRSSNVGGRDLHAAWLDVRSEWKRPAATPTGACRALSFAVRVSSATRRTTARNETQTVGRGAPVRRMSPVEGAGNHGPPAGLAAGRGRCMPRLGPGRPGRCARHLEGWAGPSGGRPPPNRDSAAKPRSGNCGRQGNPPAGRLRLPGAGCTLIGARLRPITVLPRAHQPGIAVQAGPLATG